MLAEIRDVLDEYFRLRAGLSSARSPLGAQLDALRLGMVGTTDQAVLQRNADLRHERFALLVQLWDRLTLAQQTILICYNTPVGTVDYERTVRQCDLVWEERPGELNQYRTASGEEFVRCLRDEPGFIVVRGVRAVYPSRSEVADMLGLSLRQVRTRISTAYSTLASSEQFRLLRRR